MRRTPVSATRAARPVREPASLVSRAGAAVDTDRRAPGSGLEVGSYVGAFLDAARARGWRFEGVDVNEGASRFARAQGLTVTVGTIDEVPATRRFDAVAIWNCLDQFPTRGT